MTLNPFMNKEERSLKINNYDPTPPLTLFPTTLPRFESSRKIAI